MKFDRRISAMVLAAAIVATSVGADVSSITSYAEESETSQGQMTSETETETGTEAESETETQTEAESETETETQSEVESETETQTEVESETETETQSEAESETETQTEVESETETETQSEVETETEETAADTVKVTYVVNPEGAAVVDGSTDVEKNAKFEFTVHPSEGFVIEKVQAGEELTAVTVNEDGSAVYSAEALEEDMEVSITMKEKMEEETETEEKGLELEVAGLKAKVTFESDDETLKDAVLAVDENAEVSQDIINSYIDSLSSAYELADYEVFAIHLENAEGKEVEPSSPVRVTIDFEEEPLMLDENIVKADLLHVADGAQEAECVAVVKEDTAVQNGITTMDEKLPETTQIEEISFEVSSFSPFVLTEMTRAGEEKESNILDFTDADNMPTAEEIKTALETYNEVTFVGAKGEAPAKYTENISFTVGEGKTLVIDGKLEFIDAYMKIDGTFKGTSREEDQMTITRQAKDVVVESNNAKIENVTLDVKGNETGNFNYLIYWHTGNLEINEADVSATGNKDNSGIFVAPGSGKMIATNSNLSFSDNYGPGIWADGDGNSNVIFEITGGSFKMNWNKGNGFQGTPAPWLGGTAPKPTFIFTNCNVEAMNNGERDDVVGDGFSYGYCTFTNTQWEDGVVYTLNISGNGHNGFDGGRANNGALDVDGYKIIANNNGNYGINISKLNNGKTETTIKNAEIEACGNGNTNIRITQKVTIENSIIKANGNSGDENSKTARTGIYLSSAATITNCDKIEAVGNTTTGLSNSRNLEVKNTVMNIQGSQNAHSGVYSYANEKTILDKNTVTIFEGTEMDSKFASGSRTGILEVQGGSLQASEPITYTEFVNSESTYPFNMSANPVNENGTELYRFDLNGTAGESSSVTYVDTNGSAYTYSFRYNNVGEDLDAAASGNAYVWTPVSVVNYHATEGTIDSANIGTATADTNAKLAHDITIQDNNLALTGKEIPNVTEPAGYTFEGWFIVDAGQEEHAKALAEAGNYAELYGLLNERFDTNTAVDTEVNSTEGGMTVYAKWSRQSEPTPNPDPDEPEGGGGEPTTPESTPAVLGERVPEDGVLGERIEPTQPEQGVLGERRGAATGDETQAGLWVVLTGVAVTALVTFAYRRKKEI